MAAAVAAADVFFNQISATSTAILQQYGANLCMKFDSTKYDEQNKQTKRNYKQNNAHETSKPTKQKATRKQKQNKSKNKETN
jgi:hypothetical protein